MSNTQSAVVKAGAVFYQGGMKYLAGETVPKVLNVDVVQGKKYGIFVA